MAISAKQIKELREETGARVMDCKKALEKVDGDMDKAKKIVKEQGMARAEKAAQEREVTEGYIASYVHQNNKVASMVEVLCETDFVARNEEFTSMAKDIAMQVVAMNPEDTDDLLKQDFIKDPSITVEELIKTVSGKIGERFEVSRFERFEVGETL